MPKWKLEDRKGTDTLKDIPPPLSNLRKVARYPAPLCKLESYRDSSPPPQGGGKSLQEEVPETGVGHPVRDRKIP